MDRHPCSHCRREFEYERGRLGEFPFCSRRCRMLDLSRWMDEEYAISRPMTEEEALYLASHLDEDGRTT